LGVTFDEFSGESLQMEEMKKAFEVLNKLNLIETSDGAELINLEKYNLGKVLVRKKDGSTLYITRDIGAAKGRYDRYHFDEMIYVVASQQNLHFQQLFKILELMNYDWAPKCRHINFGMIQGMSTRKGNVVFLSDILHEAQAKVVEVMKEKKRYDINKNPDATASSVGVAAVLVQDLSAKRGKDYEFDWNRITKFDGNTGPYLLYTYARLCSILRNADVSLNNNADLSLLKEPECSVLTLTLYRYPTILQNAMKTLEPLTLISYLFELCRSISSAISVIQVKGEEQALAEARLVLYACSQAVLANGLKIAGITPVEEM